jgi:predicted MFS family arabinose efflux permease
LARASRCVAIVPEIVPRESVVNAVALNAVSINLGRLVGPAAAGFLAPTAGLGVAFLIAAVGFAVFAAMVGGLAHVRPPRAHAAKGQIREALRYIARHEQLLPVFVLVGLGGVAGPNILNLAALMATEVFDEGPATVGLYGTVMAIGALAGAIGVVRLAKPSVDVVSAGALMLGLVTVVSATAAGPLVFGVLLAGAGAAALVMVSTAMGVVQVSTDGPLRGRVTSLYSIVLFSGIPLASPLLGVLADLAGVRWSIGLAGAVVAVAAIAVRAVVGRRTSSRALPVSKVT